MALYPPFRLLFSTWTRQSQPHRVTGLGAPHTPESRVEASPLVNDCSKGDSGDSDDTAEQLARVANVTLTGPCRFKTSFWLFLYRGEPTEILGGGAGK